MSLWVRRAALVLSITAALPAGAQGTALTVLGYQATAPAAWTARPPTSQMRLAMFAVPAAVPTAAPTAAPTDSAEVVVFFFGASQGGGVAANTQRWREQFTNPGAPEPTERITRDSTGAFPATIAEYEGSYRRGIGAGSVDSVRAGQGLTAAIVETPKGTLFIQLFGPARTVRAERERFLAFVRSIGQPSRP